MASKTPDKHCVKNVRIQSSYPCPYPHFPALGLNTYQKNSEYGHLLCSELYVSHTFFEMYLLMTYLWGKFKTIFLKIFVTMDSSMKQVKFSDDSLDLNTSSRLLLPTIGFVWEILLKICLEIRYNKLTSLLICHATEKYFLKFILTTFNFYQFRNTLKESHWITWTTVYKILVKVDSGLCLWEV